VNTAEEWRALVAAAVLGTDRRPLPPAPAELAAWSTATDPAVALLDRAAALVTARRAGARPLAAATPLRPATADPRPACPPAVAHVLGRLLRRGERELIGECLRRIHERGWRLPAEHAPAVLRRARGDPQLDGQARAVAGPLAKWLDEVLPTERPVTRPAVVPPAAALDVSGRDAVDEIVRRFLTGGAGAHRAALRATVLAMDPRDLPRLAAALDAVAGLPLTAGLRRELADLARLRADLVDACR
jgi:hypothetical protein